MSSPFVAEIRIFPFNFAPKGWAFCDGQILPISQNTALFSLVGTIYGGDGRSNFALPDLQGSVPIFWGQGPGLSVYDQGEQSGTETVTLLQSEMPSHNHTAHVLALGAANANTPDGNSILAASNGGQAYVTATNGPSTTQMASIQPSGSSFPHNNMMPYLTVNFCIALQGIYPPRS